jgi:hypothetical protein
MIPILRSFPAKNSGVRSDGILSPLIMVVMLPARTAAGTQFATQTNYNKNHACPN